MTMPFIITVDGLSATGTTTLARDLGTALAMPWFGIGNMFRYIAREALLRPNDISQAFSANLAALSLTSVTTDNLNDPELQNPLYSEITTTHLLAHPVHVVLADDKIRDWVASKPAMIVEGKHAGTGIFPAADIKFYLYSDMGSRARRRARQLHIEPTADSIAAMKGHLQSRDAREQQMLGLQLWPAPHAYFINTGGDVHPATTLRIAMAHVQRVAPHLG